MMFRWIFLIVFLLSHTTLAAQPRCKDFEGAVSKGSPLQQLKTFMTLHWDYTMMEFPEWATSTGYPGQDDRWTDLSLEAHDRRLADLQCQLKALQKIKRARLKGEDRINLDLLLYTYSIGIEEHAFGGHLLVVNQLGGPAMDLADMMEMMPKTHKKDFENRIKRLEKFSAVVDQHLALLREGLKQKITPVQRLMNKVPPQFDQVLTSRFENSPLYKPFEAKIEGVPEAEMETLRSRALAVIRGQVYPSLRQLKDFIVKEYIPHCRTDIALSHMPNGKNWYALMVKSQTTTDQTPEQLHQLGLNEVARIKSEMEKIKASTSFKGDLASFNRYLLQDQKFYYKSADELMSAYRSVAKQMDPQLPLFFKRLPRLTYGVREMPAYKAATAPAAYYNSGSLETGRAGYFEANTFDLKASPTWAV